MGRKLETGVSLAQSPHSWAQGTMSAGAAGDFQTSRAALWASKTSLVKPGVLLYSVCLLSLLFKTMWVQVSGLAALDPLSPLGVGASWALVFLKLPRCF